MNQEFPTRQLWWVVTSQACDFFKERFSSQPSPFLCIKVNTPLMCQKSCLSIHDHPQEHIISVAVL